MIADLRLGRWQDVLADVREVDALICDPPYSERTHAGERGLRLDEATDRALNKLGLHAPRNAIGYTALLEADCAAFVAAWAGRARHWVVMFGDDVTWQWWRAAWDSVGWTTFAPVVWVKKDAPPRFSGDGPTSSCEYLCVARPARRVRDSGSRPGHYVVCTQTGRGGSASGVVGQKDLEGMRRLVRDYSAPGDLICDPFAGTGTTLAAARIEGRRSVGAEMDPKTYEIARRRLALDLGDTAAGAQLALGRAR